MSRADKIPPRRTGVRPVTADSMVQNATKGVGRRQVWRLAADGAALSTAPHLAAAIAPSETAAATIPQPRPDFTDDQNASDVIIETLMRWGVSHVFGVVGDGINPLIEALRKRRGKIAFIPTRHEEAAAFMVCGFAKHTGRLGVCTATPGQVQCTS
jgi:pyruvate dehydrogenase (quinone)